jgi:hypothetical protein
MGKMFLTDHSLIGDQQIATHAQDCTDILEFNKNQRKDSDENWRLADEDIKPVARIPRVVWLRLQQLGIDDQAQELMKYLEANPQYKRTEKQIGEKPKQYYDLAAPLRAE